MRQKKILVKTGGRNECENLPRILETLSALRSELPFDVLLIDDGSTDGTTEIVQASGYQHICFPECCGISAGHRAALQWALTHAYDYCITMDGDGQHDPHHLIKVIAALDDGVNFAQCSRYTTPEEYGRTPLDRRLLLDAVNGMLRRYVGWDPFTDPMCGFWGMDRTTIERILPHLTQEGYAFQIEAVLRLWYMDPRPRRQEIPHPAIYTNGTERLDDLYTDAHLGKRLQRFAIHADCIFRAVREMRLDQSVGRGWE